MKDALNHTNMLHNNGFIHIKNILPIDSVNITKTYLDRLFERSKSIPAHYLKKYSTTPETTDGDIFEINHCIKFDPRLQNNPLFNRCQDIASKLLGKTAYRTFDHAIYKSRNSGEIYWHQDQAYKKNVKNMRSIIMWIPLHDISTTEGCMQYIPLSYENKLVPHIRNDESGSLYVNVAKSAPIHTCEAKIGDVIIHKPLTFHSSLPNKSNEIRKAWILHFGPYGRFEPFIPTNLPYLVRSIMINRQA